MNAYIYDYETNTLIPFEEYQEKQKRKEEEKKIEELAKALEKVLSEKLVLSVDLISGEIKVRKKEINV